MTTDINDELTQLNQDGYLGMGPRYGDNYTYHLVPDYQEKKEPRRARNRPITLRDGGNLDSTTLVIYLSDDQEYSINSKAS
jgi:hypothetical protein